MPRNRTISAAAAALSMFLPLAPASAADAGSHRALVEEAQTDNAALLYVRCFTTLSGLCEGLEWKPGQALSPELAERLAASSADAVAGIPALVRASLKPDCDFGIEYEQGPGAMLPHVAQMRKLATLLCADAARLGEAGDSDAAADRLATVFRMSRHIDNDAVVISSLVAMAMTRTACDTAQDLARHDRLAAGARADLVAHIDAYDAEDPFGLEAAIANEGKFMVEWAIGVGGGPQAGQRLADLLVNDYAGDETDVAAIRALDEAGVKREARKFQRLAQDAVAALRADDPAAAVAALDDRAKDPARYGLLSPSLAAGVARMHNSESEALTNLRATRAALTD